MMAMLVDSNVLLDVMTEDPRWLSWSAQAIEQAADSYRLVINPVIYAEVSMRYSQSGCFSRSQSIPGLSAPRRNQTIAAAGLFHRGSRGCRRISADDTRPRARSHLFPRADAYRSRSRCNRLGLLFYSKQHPPPLRRWIADIATLRRVRGIGALLGRAAEADYPKLIGWVGTINPPAVTRALAAVDEARIRTTALDR